MADEQENNKDMSVSEAGRKGGERVRELVEEGKENKGGPIGKGATSEDEDEPEV